MRLFVIIYVTWLVDHFTGRPVWRLSHHHCVVVAGNAINRKTVATSFEIEHVWQYGSVYFWFDYFNLILWRNDLLPYFKHCIALVS